MKNDTSVLNSFSSDAKRYFKERMQFYSLDDTGEKLEYVTNDIPDWLKFSGVSAPLVFTVVKPQNIEQTIHGYFENMMYTGGNYKTLFDKIIRSRLLGISRSDVVEYLRTKPLERHLISHVAKKPYVKSYRPKYPFEHWQIDHINFDKLELGRKKTNNGYKHVLVIIDIFSKFVYLFPCRTKNMDEVASILQKLFLGGDIPEKIGADDAFDNKIIKRLCDTFHIKIIIGLPYHPEHQGFVENKNKHVKSLIAHHFAKYNTYTFYDILDHIAFTINNTKHSVTKLTPFSLHRGRDISVDPHHRLNELQNSLSESIAIIESNSHDNCSELTKQEIENYKKSSEIVHKSKVQYAKQQIHKTADKREKSLNLANLSVLKINDSVKIFAFRDLDDKIQPIVLRLVKIDHEKQFENPLYYFARTDPILKRSYTKRQMLTTKPFPKSIFPKMLIKTAKFDFRVDNILVDEFIVTDIFKKGRNDFFKLKYKYNNEFWNVEQLTRARKSQYTNEFSRDLLYRIDSPVPKSTYKPEIQSIDLVNRQQYIPAKLAEQKNETENISYLSKSSNNQNEEYSNEALHFTALNLFKKEYDYLTKTSRAETKLTDVKIEHVFEFDEPSGNKILNFDRASGIIKRYSRAQNQKNTPWDVSYGGIIYKLTLDPQKYSIDTDNPQEGNWYFKDPIRVMNALHSRKFVQI